MTMFNIIRSAIVMLVLFTLITGIAYPFVVTVFAQAMFHHQANGSVIVEGTRAEVVAHPRTREVYLGV